ncbi:MAG: hypothetical protein M3389_14250, partial [Actinomycetota bacterium]|nr:hypothetical protein [Actinomycetota bacterium]
MLLVPRLVLLCGPFALAFFSGGFFTGPRLVAGVVAWALLCVALVALARRGERVGRPAPFVLAALGGLVLLVAWTGLSAAWAPVGSAAADSFERGLLYLGALGAAFLAFRGGTRVVAPALALGAVVVIGYGLAGRVLPSIVELTRTRSAGGRLDQPLTYWNATGALAALGLVLVAHLAGDRTRPLQL